MLEVIVLAIFMVLVFTGVGGRPGRTRGRSRPSSVGTSQPVVIARGPSRANRPTARSVRRALINGPVLGGQVLAAPPPAGGRRIGVPFGTPGRTRSLPGRGLAGGTPEVGWQVDEAPAFPPPQPPTPPPPMPTPGMSQTGRPAAEPNPASPQQGMSRFVQLTMQGPARSATTHDARSALTASTLLAHADAWQPSCLLNSAIHTSLTTSSLISNALMTSNVQPLARGPAPRRGSATGSASPARPPA